MSAPCPDPERLFVDLAEDRPPAREHLAECEACAALVELHRQLEKDLLRLSDPLPPPDFVHRVMARVEAQPVAPARELLTFGGILAATLVALVGLVVSDAGTAGAWGMRAAELVGALGDGLEVVGRASLLVWETSALGLAVAAVMAVATLGLAARRLLGARASA